MQYPNSFKQISHSSKCYFQTLPVTLERQTAKTRATPKYIQKEEKRGRKEGNTWFWRQYPRGWFLYVF